jgi:hypothetical protein
MLDLRSREGKGHSLRALRAEIIGALGKETRELGYLGQIASHLADGTRLHKISRDDQVLHKQAVAIIEQALLTQETYALRLPQLVGHLTGHLLRWAQIVRPLLTDLASPPGSPDESAEILVGLDAPNQALMLATYLPVELQTRAQRRADQLEGETIELIRELTSYDDVDGNYDVYRSLGRWQLALGDLRVAVEIAQEEHRQREAQHDQRARTLMEELGRLNLALLDCRSQMSPTAYEQATISVNRAMSAVQLGIGDGVTFDAVASFLEEMSYQTTHRSWPLDKLQEIAGALDRSLGRQPTEIGSSFTSAQVLAHLEHGELQQLHLNPDSFEASRVETRIKVLYYWLKLNSIRVQHTDEMTEAERSIISSLYEQFAKMATLRAVRDMKDERLVVHGPIPYEVFELVYPKAFLLVSHCVLIALSGDPPDKEHIRRIEELLDDENLLDDRFVFLFAPGCTPQLKRRLETRYERKGLVLIDDATMVDIVLAEVEQRNPVGRLRSLMLNAKALIGGIDIFKINQLVRPRTAIFVGRDLLVEQLAATGNNYALYGGRRIGKSSILSALEGRLRRRQNTRVVLQSLEGKRNCTDDVIARDLARELDLAAPVENLEDFRIAIQATLDQTPEMRIAVLLDEIDKYIVSNPQRHLLIEVFRALSDRYTDRFRVVVAGFMNLFDCVKGRGPYTSTSDPWRRMMDDIGPIPNLSASQAENIVHEGFRNILGWRYESRLIPQTIVERTGGHPAFVQYFCMKLQQLVEARRDQMLRKQDISAVFEDEDPEHAFIAYVKKTLEMNLDPIGHLLILLIADDAKETRRFTRSQFESQAAIISNPISTEELSRSLESLVVTSVVRRSQSEVYEFTVPDYPLILSRLGATSQGHLEELDRKIGECLEHARGIN